MGERWPRDGAGMRDPEGFSVQPLLPRSLPCPHSSLWAPAPSSCPAQRAQSPVLAPPAPSPPQGGLLGGQREWGLSPQPGTQSPGAGPARGHSRSCRLRASWSVASSPSHRAPSCPAPGKDGTRRPEAALPPWWTSSIHRGCVHSPEPPSTSARCPVPSSQGPHLPPAPRPCQWPPLSTPQLVHTNAYPSCVPSALLSAGHSDRVKGWAYRSGRMSHPRLIPRGNH